MEMIKFCKGLTVLVPLARRGLAGNGGRDDASALNLRGGPWGGVAWGQLGGWKGRAFQRRGGD